MAKNCNLCRHFTDYYTKAYCGYYQEKFGRCEKHDKICDKHESCKDYQTKTYKKSLKQAFVINALSKALTDISVIQEVLEERTLK